ncbi:hypothetical protein CDD83_7420 [Cordyceps sp. RAO-2017]|nr:hypothetical protein CDD83_7420 [Cordyceps sp. RAO-2017]
MGYDVGHRDIELLKLRNYTLGARLDAEALCRDDALQSVADAVRALSGFVAFLNGIVMPDPQLEGEGESSSDEDGDAAEEEE